MSLIFVLARSFRAFSLLALLSAATPMVWSPSLKAFDAPITC